MSPLQFTRRPTSTPSLSSPGARNGLLGPWGGHLTHDHQLRHLLHIAEVRIGNTFRTKQMWAVVFYDWNIFVGWVNMENIFSGGCEVYEGMISWRPGATGTKQRCWRLRSRIQGCSRGRQNSWLHHPVSSIYHPWWDIMLAIFNYMLYIGC